MAFCTECGNKMEEGSHFCGVCGAPAYADTENKEDKNYGIGLAILSYIGILVIVAIAVSDNSKFVRFHANQGLVLFLAEIIIGTIYFAAFIFMLIFAQLSMVRTLWFIMVFTMIFISILLFVLSVIGIVNAAKGRMKRLPVIGNINLLK